MSENYCSFCHSRLHKMTVVSKRIRVCLDLNCTKPFAGIERVVREAAFQKLWPDGRRAAIEGDEHLQKRLNFYGLKKETSP